MQEWHLYIFAEWFALRSCPFVGMPVCWVERIVSESVCDPLPWTRTG